jgi:hypothetical protein
MNNFCAASGGHFRNYVASFLLVVLTFYVLVVITLRWALAILIVFSGCPIAKIEQLCCKCALAKNRPEKEWKHWMAVDGGVKCTSAKHLCLKTTASKAIPSRL